MPLRPGTRLGPYEILSPIGAGGMGEVYKARDSRLDRAVALKVIHSSVADSAEIRERFEREAKAISALDHPNICILYDVSREGDMSFLVMQYLEGETLADRLARVGKPSSDPSRPSSGADTTTLATISRGPIPVDTALKYATEIALALDAAHRRGIVHRDLKPGNVMLTKAGTKLLDFGLAKLAAGDGAGHAALFGDGVTRTTPLTSQGAILGTLHYMSPEQLEGRDVDARSDIHAFGVLLYEMLTGRRAFDGSSQAGIIAAIIGAAPPSFSSLADPRATLPVLSQRALDRLLARCLAKNPDDRWQSAGDLAAELQWIAEERLRAVPETASTTAASDDATRRPSARTRERAWMAATAASLIALAAAATLWYPRAAQPPAPISFTINPPEGQQLSGGPGLLALSPDGRQLAFTTFSTASAQTRLWIRALGSLDAQPIERADGAWQLAFSHDGRELLFGGANGLEPLRRLDIAGGVPSTIAPAVATRATWGRDVVLYASDGKLYRVPSSGGQSEVVMEPDLARQETVLGWPMFLPDGRRYLFLAQNNDASKNSIFLAAVDSRDRTFLLNAMSNIDYAGGYLFYQRDGTLMAHPFDAAAARLTGNAFPVVENIRYNSANGRAAFSVSESGALAYVSGSSIQDSSGRKIALFDRSGKRIRQIGAIGSYLYADFSPNGREAIVTQEMGNPPVRTLELLDLERGVFTRFTVGSVDERWPVWSTDGSSIIFASTRADKSGIYRRNAGGGATSDELLFATTDTVAPSAISSDGQQLLVTRGLGARQRIWVLQLKGDRTFVEASPGATVAQLSARFSPDGKWIVYVESTGPSAGEIYIQPYPADGRRVHVSPAGGRYAYWTADGRSIVYRTLDDKMVTVQLTAEAGTYRPSAPVELFTQARVSQLNWAFSMDPQASHFLLVEPPDKPVVEKPAAITVVVNFVQSLANKMR